MSFDFLFDKRPHIEHSKALIDQTLSDLLSRSNRGVTSTASHSDNCRLDHALNLSKTLIKDLLSVYFTDASLSVKEFLQVN